MFEKLDLLYNNFFEENLIHPISGVVANLNKRFATKIAIGDNYLKSDRKLLFISLDIGIDEFQNENKFQSYQERKVRALNEDLSNKNPHMAGVYGTALYFLKDQNNWNNEWKIFADTNKFFRESINHNANSLPKNVLSYISLINFYSFVTIGRQERTGNNDRFFMNEKSEIKLLINIINTISPDVIIVQSKSLKYHFNYIINEIDNKIEIYIGYHPSVFGRGIKYRKPKLYIEDLINNGKIK